MKQVEQRERKDFLLEIGTEEIPARFMEPALQQLAEEAGRLLAEERLEGEEIRTYGTPRRLVLWVKGLTINQQPLVQEIKGPAARVAFDEEGKPTRAALGFARSQGIEVSELIIKPVGAVDYVFAVKKEPGRPALSVLGELVPRLIAALHFPKPMRWGELDVRFARPIRWLLVLLGEEVVPCSYAGVTSGRLTYGHRFLAPGPFEVRDPSDYFRRMENSYVVVDPSLRRDIIRRQAEELVRARGGRVVWDEELLTEVVYLVEYPTAFTGRIDPTFLEMPRAVIETPMREHQRYFPVEDGEGRLLPFFIAVRNGTDAYLDEVRAGNERVLKARLQDAAFFWREDLRRPLADRVEELRKIVWLEGLGSLYQRVERLRQLGVYFSRVLGFSPGVAEVVERAAYLAKADLVTSMVYEFPELQGIMGEEYARRNGEPPEVARAIYEHYLPRFAGDELPATPAGIALSLAEKFDVLTGCFAAGIQPTGSADPYALRRQALGIINLTLEKKLIYSLQKAIAAAYAGYRQQELDLKLLPEQVTADLVEFFAGRLRVWLGERGFAYDVIEAVLAAGIDDLAGVLDRVEALANLREAPEFAFVLTAFTRAYNLARQLEKSGEPSEELLFHEAEKELYRVWREVRKEVEALLAERRFAQALTVLTRLQEPIAAFFDRVMVMVEDERLRYNRLYLLKGIADLALRIADLSKVKG